MGLNPYQKVAECKSQNNRCSSFCLLPCCHWQAGLHLRIHLKTHSGEKSNCGSLPPAQAPCCSHWQGLQRIHLRHAGPLRLLLRQGGERRDCTRAFLGLLSTRVAPLHQTCPASASDLNTPAVLFSTNLSLHQALFASAAPGFSAPEKLSRKVLAKVSKYHRYSATQYAI